jgi:phosphoenolpyruvate carboxykinase (ATP)
LRKSKYIKQLQSPFRHTSDAWAALVVFKLDAEQTRRMGMTDTESITRALSQIGIIRPGRVYANLPVPRLVEEALARGEGTLTLDGALVAQTGKRTGRSPGDKFLVKYVDGESAARIAWGKVNQPIAPATFERLRARVNAYLQGRDLFVVDAYAGADPRYGLPIRLVTEFAWHALFAHQLFRRLDAAGLATHQPEWTVICAPRFYAEPALDGTNSETAVILDVEQKLILICGSEYAGENKKSIFSALNYVLPLQDVLPMHCSANAGADGELALFFGLSGTGKTTLSADPARKLIGDDEHGWSDTGVFNFEGGCYAKCINLSRENEPQIWNAIRFGAVVENVVVDPLTRKVDYADTSLTENTRVAYPVEYIDNAELSGVGGHPRTIIFLTADAFGVLPPIARLLPAQARYHFLSGYTAKTAGTEMGVQDPEATFSACFGAPFLPLAPQVYARMLGEKLARHDVRVFLLNTGWTGGPYGVGERIKLSATRTMVNAALSGALDQAETYTDPVFGLRVPLHIPGVPDAIMQPRKTWRNPNAYDAKARDLAARFIENFKQFEDVSEDVVAAGPQV